MAYKSIKQKQNEMLEKQKKRREFVNEMKKHHSNEKYDRVDVESKDKVNAIDYYNSLSESQKIDFDNALRRKEIKENYVKYLKFVYGDNYKITKFHALLSSICERAIKEGEKGKKVRLLLSVPPQHGKGYPIDFPVLTTKGWKKHGDLQVGDYVYNDNGEQVKVLGNQKPYMHPCLKVNFANGESHIVTREHLWKVFIEKEHRINGIHHNIREEQILETQEIALTNYRRSPYVLINKPLKNKEKNLLIDPYILGLWLGDGCSANNQVVSSDSDLPNLLNAIGNKEVYQIKKYKRKDKVSFVCFGNEQKKIGKCGFTNDFRERLSKLKVLNSKHIPIDYLLASEEQRWELLRGLMDTDGSCDKRGCCEFCNINKELAYQTYTLLHSLGIKARIHEYSAMLYGRFISKKYRVTFTPYRTDTIFKLQRKQDRLFNKIFKDREDKNKYFIKSIEEVGEKLVSCISVEGGMYLAGEELIPTHNSLTLTETLPSWLFIRNPEKRAIVTAYNADIAEKFGDKNRQLIKNFGKEFGCEVSDSQDNKTLWNIKDHLGGLYATGLSGSLTSNNGFLIIVDDPFKNGEEADSPSIRDRVWETFRDSVMTRQAGSGNVIIVIHTRWHEDDLIGRILDSEVGDEWTYVNIPCVWDNECRNKFGEDRLLHRKVGETLCPELGFDSAWAESMRKLLGARKWNALYQGRPFSDKGDILSREYIKTYGKNDRPQSFEEITLSCDLAFGSDNPEDPSALAVWGRVGGNHYLIECINKKMSFTASLERVRFLCGKYPTMTRKIVESKASGGALINTLNNEIGGFVPYDPKMLSKVERLKLCLPYFESGNVFYPDDTIDKDSELYIQQLVRFPKATHDEIVDITTQYLLNYQYKYSGKLLTDDKYATISEAFRGLKL